MKTKTSPTLGDFMRTPQRRPQQAARKPRTAVHNRYECLALEEENEDGTEMGMMDDGKAKTKEEIHFPKRSCFKKPLIKVNDGMEKQLVENNFNQCPSGCGCDGKHARTRRQRKKFEFNEEVESDRLQELMAGLEDEKGDKVIVDEPVHMFMDEEINEFSERPKWQRIEAVMDSGAADSVAPASMAPWIPVEESPGSRKGQHYLSASGDRIPNLGQKRLSVVTEEGHPTCTTYQIADVTRPLCAVSRMCDSGNKVIFHKDGGYVESPDGKKTAFRRERNVYLLSTWIREEAPGFTGQ